MTIKQILDLAMELEEVTIDLLGDTVKTIYSGFAEEVPSDLLDKEISSWNGYDGGLCLNIEAEKCKCCDFEYVERGSGDYIGLGLGVENRFYITKNRGTYRLCFKNTSNEIAYCPMCGRKLEDET